MAPQPAREPKSLKINEQHEVQVHVENARVLGKAEVAAPRAKISAPKSVDLMYNGLKVENQ